VHEWGASPVLLALYHPVVGQPDIVAEVAQTEVAGTVYVGAAAVTVLLVLQGLLRTQGVAVLLVLGWY